MSVTLPPVAVAAGLSGAETDAAFTTPRLRTEAFEKHDVSPDPARQLPRLIEADEASID